MAVRVHTSNDRLLNVNYFDLEEIKSLISGWGALEKLAESGDVEALVILIDLQRAIGISITEMIQKKSAGLEAEKGKSGVLTEAQFVSIIYVLGLGYSQEEVAFILSCTKQTVSIHIHRGLKRIGRFLNGERAKHEKNKKKRGRSRRQVVKKA